MDSCPTPVETAPVIVQQEQEQSDSDSEASLSQIRTIVEQQVQPQPVSKIQSGSNSHARKTLTEVRETISKGDESDPKQLLSQIRRIRGSKMAQFFRALYRHFSADMDSGRTKKDGIPVENVIIKHQFGIVSISWGDVSKGKDSGYMVDLLMISDPPNDLKSLFTSRGNRVYSDTAKVIMESHLRKEREDEATNMGYENHEARVEALKKDNGYQYEVFRTLMAYKMVSAFKFKS